MAKYSTRPSGAGAYVRAKRTNGWGFWLVDLSTGKSLKQVRAEYRDQMTVDGSGAEGEEEDAE